MYKTLLWIYQYIRVHPSSRTLNKKQNSRTNQQSQSNHIQYKRNAHGSTCIIYRSSYKISSQARRKAKENLPKAPIIPTDIEQGVVEHKGTFWILFPGQEQETKILRCLKCSENLSKRSDLSRDVYFICLYQTRPKCSVHTQMPTDTLKSDQMSSYTQTVEQALFYDLRICHHHEQTHHLEAKSSPE